MNAQYLEGQTTWTWVRGILFIVYYTYAFYVLSYVIFVVYSKCYIEKVPCKENDFVLFRLIYEFD